MFYCWNGDCKFPALCVLLKIEVLSIQNILVHVMGYLELRVFSKAAALYWKGKFLLMFC